MRSIDLQNWQACWLAGYRTKDCRCRIESKGFASALNMQSSLAHAIDPSAQGIGVDES